MKSGPYRATPGGAAVAPCAGAGIEMRRRRKEMAKKPSPPVRGRGLKRRLIAAPGLFWSRPLRGGGD